MAHILSLDLASNLWRKTSNSNLSSAREREALKELLARNSNFQEVCAFANRTLHVRYDSEIVKALKSGDNVQEGKKKKKQKNIELSPGAKTRKKQILNFLKKDGINKSQDEKIKKFCQSSVDILKNIK